jgi:hypothetical protein
VVKARPRAVAYVRFDLRALHAAVVRARLRLYARSAGAALVVRSARDPFWDERSVTYARAPATGARIAVLRRLRRGWNQLDLTRYARGRYLVSLAVSASRGRALIASRESGSLGPRLVLQTRAVASATMVAAGDIAGCDTTGDEATAAIVDGIPGTVAALGDLAYESGTAAEFANCYDPSWGRFKSRTRPTPGNHEYYTSGAAPYYAYFGTIAGPPGNGYYSYDIGAWHAIVLNSNCGAVGGCGPGSPQARWLLADLAAHRRFCTLAYWHHPRFSSGQRGDDSSMSEFWKELYRADADLVLVGHDHDYERFAPQRPTAKPDPNHGIREFVVGTGGESHLPFVARKRNSQVRNNDTFGVLRLTLWAAGYDFRFVPVAGGAFTDSGSGVCH